MCTYGGIEGTGIDTAQLSASQRTRPAQHNAEQKEWGVDTKTGLYHPIHAYHEIRLTHLQIYNTTEHQSETYET